MILYKDIRKKDNPLLLLIKEKDVQDFTLILNLCRSAQA
jgi:hypothetical protein